MAEDHCDGDATSIWQAEEKEKAGLGLSQDLLETACVHLRNGFHRGVDALIRVSLPLNNIAPSSIVLRRAAGGCASLGNSAKSTCGLEELIGSSHEQEAQKIAVCKNLHSQRIVNARQAKS